MLAPPDMWRIITLSVVWSVLGVILISVPSVHMNFAPPEKTHVPTFEGPPQGNPSATSETEAHFLREPSVLWVAVSIVAFIFVLDLGCFGSSPNWAVH